MGLHYTRSLASRVTLLATTAVGLSVAFVALAAFLTVRHQLQDSMDRSLLHRAAQAARSPAINQLGANKVPSWAVGAGDVKILFVFADGGQISADDAGSRSFTLGTPEIAVARGKAGYVIRTVVGRSGARYRVATVPSAQNGVALALAQSLQPNDYTLDKLGLVLFVFGATGVILAAAAGWGVATSGLRPVRRLTEAAEEIARTEKLMPIEVQGDDEIARLARAFNAMLLALSASRDRQRQLVADAGHELRTPLTSLRTNLELLDQADSRGGLSAASRAELMGDVRFQIEELTTLIGDLTELAREEPVEVTLGEVDLAEITDRAVERVRRRASGLAFDVKTEPWWLVGESAALERAVTNLLDNAAKWSPPLGTVTIRLAEGTLMVADQGRGISEQDLPHVFDRFYRSPEARPLPGSGLGLSIVRQVAERHGGAVRAGSAEDGGAAFWMTLPGSPSPSMGTPES